MATVSLKAAAAETEIAVLQVQVKNIEEKVFGLKDGLKDLHTTIDNHSKEHSKLISDMQEASESAHKALSEKISSLEKWRWMMMGAGVLIGSLGFDTISKLFK